MSRLVQPIGFYGATHALIPALSEAPFSLHTLDLGSLWVTFLPGAEGPVLATVIEEEV